MSEVFGRISVELGLVDEEPDFLSEFREGEGLADQMHARIEASVVSDGFRC